MSNPRRMIRSALLAVAALSLVACGTSSRRSGGSRGGGGGGGTGGGTGGQAAAVRPDNTAYVSDQGEKAITGGSADLQAVASDSGRAALFLSAGAVGEDVTIEIVARELSEFPDTEDVVNGIYDFMPHELDIEGTVNIVLPLNDIAVRDIALLRLVRWEGTDMSGEDLPNVALMVGAVRSEVSANVDRLGIYGLRIVGGWGALIVPEETGGGDIEDGEGDSSSTGGDGGGDGACPAPRDEIPWGVEEGQVFPEPSLRNGDATTTKLHEYCGNKAVLMVSSAFW